MIIVVIWFFQGSIVGMAEEATDGRIHWTAFAEQRERPPDRHQQVGALGLASPLDRAGAFVPEFSAGRVTSWAQDFGDHGETGMVDGSLAGNFSISLENFDGNPMLIAAPERPHSRTRYP